MEISAALDFARPLHDGVLTTIRRNGRPQLSNINYQVEANGTIRISMTTDRAKYLNLARDPRASIHVTLPDFGQWVVLDADASLTPAAASIDDPTVEALVDLYRSVLGEHPDWDEYRAAMVTERRAVATLTPTYAYGQLR